MAYQKRRSATLEKAQARLRGLRTLLAALQLGNGLTLQNYAALIEAVTALLEAHNLALAEADRTRIELAEMEVSLSALSSRILSAVAATYGKDSKEYELAGGKFPSNYRRTKKQLEPTSLNEFQVSNGTSNVASSNGSATNGTTRVNS
ncbi:MAG: hypothetical protein HC879_21685 [Leptolyngbyaceae cyanobacterium SL_5_9]|nr:hypothetical protein [Leptolyngbyaceae cyanobacterium SL_5_9]NJO73521.1 hypothetical protein [Leptolyngbyaceae cyanobacterium RM1_406_9]